MAHAAGARAPTAGETRARERRTPGERRHRPQGGGARGLVPEAERDSAETAGPLPAAAQDPLNDIVLGGRGLRCELASDEGREHLEPHCGQISGFSFQTFALSRAQWRFLTLTNSLSSSSSSTVITSGVELASSAWIHPNPRRNVTA